MTSVAAVTPAPSAARAAPALSVRIECHRGAISAVGDDLRLSAVVRMPVPSGLVRTSRSPGRAAGVGEQPVGVHLADDREPEFRLRVVDRVAAEQQAAGPPATRGAPAITSPSRSKGSSSRGQPTRLRANSGVPPMA